MRGGWDIVRLGDVCKTAKAKHDGEPLPYVGMEHIESGTGRLAVEPTPTTVKSATFRFDEGHLLYGRLRPYLNKVLISGFEGHCSTEIFPIECGTRLDRRFLFHWLTSESTVRRIDRTSTGTRMPRANVSAVFDFDLPLPPLPEQKRIVAILDEAFAGIDAAIANTEKNLVNARELFESQLNAVFEKPARSAESHPLEELAAPDSPITYGVVKPGPEGEIPFVRGGDVSKGAILIEQLRTISSTVSEQYSRTLLRGGEILVSLVGQPGEVAVAPRSLTGANIARQVGLIRLREGFSASYIALYLRSPLGQDALGAYQGGSVQQVINLRDLKRVTIPLPETDDQARICEELAEAETQATRLVVLYARKLAILTDLRQSILQKAFSGRLTAESEKSLAEVI